MKGLVGLILGIVLKIFGILFNSKRRAEFEKKQHDDASEAERRIRDRIDNIKPSPDPNVKDGKIDGRNDDDVFNNKRQQ